LFTGHYAVSFAGKAAEKRIPLWLLFIAVQFVDVLWSIFSSTGHRERPAEHIPRFARAMN
jgi:hypothetical protein